MPLLPIPVSLAALKVLYSHGTPHTSLPESLLIKEKPREIKIQGRKQFHPRDDQEHQELVKAEN